MKEHAIQSPRDDRTTPSSYQAVILAAGAGSRLRESRESAPKPLTEVAGFTLLEHAVRVCHDAGVSDIVVVLGYEGDEIRMRLPELVARHEMPIRAATNEDWQLGNGASVLAAAPYVHSPFLLMMCDHLIHPDLLTKLIGADRPSKNCTLAIDPDPSRCRDVEEATKILFDGPRIAAIGKSLPSYDAIDTGVFLCRELLFDALREAAADGQHSLSEAVQLLATRGEVTWVSSDGLPWIDVDTPDDLQYARGLLAGGVWPANPGVPAVDDVAARI